MGIRWATWNGGTSRRWQLEGCNRHIWEEIILMLLFQWKLNENIETAAGTNCNTNPIFQSLYKNEVANCEKELIGLTILTGINVSCPALDEELPSVQLRGEVGSIHMISSCICPLSGFSPTLLYSFHILLCYDLSWNITVKVDLCMVCIGRCTIPPIYRHRPPTPASLEGVLPFF